jgi:alpha-N-arabinofuranosidase
MMPAGPLRGKIVELSGYVISENGATAVLGLISFVRGRPSNIATATDSGGSGDWTLIRQQYTVPDDPSVQLGVICSVIGKSGAAWFDDMAIRPLEAGASIPAAALPRPPLPAARSGPGSEAHSGAAGPSGVSNVAGTTVEIDAAAVIRKIPRTLYGANVEWIWNGNGLWLEKEHTFDPRLLDLIKDLGVSLIRYPGGTVADFYHWKDGVGPYENRPMAVHGPIAGDRSRPNFGTDEALDFAARIGAELLIVVNAGTGSPQEAADWVRYVNREALRVRYWEVGNELYLNDGSPAQNATAIDPHTYAARFLEFARAMRAADPRIQIGAIGGENQGHYQVVSYPDWDRIVLEAAGGQIDFLAVHNSYAPGISNEREDIRTVYRALFAAPALIAENLRTLQTQIGKYAPTRTGKIGIAVTEWGPMFQVDPKGPWVLHNKTLGSAIFAASALKAFLESPITNIANFHVLNDISIMGWIGSRNAAFPPNPDWTPTPRYYAFQLYTHHFGDRLITTRATGPTFDTKRAGGIDPLQAVPYLDVVSSLTPDGKLCIIAVNRDFDRTIETAFRLHGFRPAAEGAAWTLHGSGLDANTGTLPVQLPGVTWAQQVTDKPNPRFYRGGDGEVQVSSSSVSHLGTEFTYRFPPLSVTALVLNPEGGRQ